VQQQLGLVHLRRAANQQQSQLSLVEQVAEGTRNKERQRQTGRKKGTDRWGNVTH
jgi:hypothetical protein